MNNCTELAEPSRGIITFENQADLRPSTFERTPGTVVTLQCLQPNVYELRGATKLTCLESGQWDSTPPKCFPILRSTQSPGVTVAGESDENTVILAVVGAILCSLLLVVIIILTYLLCKWWNRKSYVAKRIMYADSQPGTSFSNLGKGSVFGTSTEFNKSYQHRGHSRRSSDVSARTSSTTFTRHSMIVLPKPAYSHSYGPFWYYPIPDDQNLASSAMRSVMDYHEDMTSMTTEQNPLFDPQVDYLQYPEAANAVDTMGRPAGHRPGILLGSETGSQSTRSGRRYYKVNAERHRPREPELVENDAEQSVLSGRSGRSGHSGRSGRDNPALEPEEQITTVDLDDSD